MSDKKMTKMEAVGCLCQIKADLERQIKHAEERLAAGEADIARLGFREEVLVELRRHVRALEMAGTAMMR